MKNLTKYALLLTACTSVPAGEIIEYTGPEAWTPNPQVTFAAGGVMEIRGKTEVVSARSFPVDPAGNVKLSFEVRRAPGSPETLAYLGFWPLDADKVRIEPLMVRPVSGTGAILRGAVQAGATSIVMTRPEKWPDHPRALAGWGIAFNAGPDRSDLPNTAVYAIKDAVPDENGNLKITFKSPLRSDYPDGTPLRAHSNGPGMYSALDARRLPETWQRVECVVSGLNAEVPTMNKWWIGTKFARIRILANYGSEAENTIMEIRHIKLELE